MYGIAKINQFWQEATEGNRGEQEQFKENFRFYCGGEGQWDPADIAELDKAGKPHLSINLIKSNIDLISGYQRRYRQNVQVLPRRNGSVQGAEIRTELGRHAMDSAQGDYELSECFLNGIRGAVGWMHLWAQRTWQDPTGGDLVVKNESPFAILPDPLATSYDVNRRQGGCRYIFKVRWLDNDQIKLEYPAAEIEKWPSEPEDGDFRMGTSLGNNDDDYHSGPDDKAAQTGLRVRWRVKECWYRSWHNEHILCDREGLYQRRLAPGELAKAQLLARYFRHLRVVDYLAPRLHMITTLGDNTLAQRDYPRQLNKLPFVRFCPYWVDGQPLGMIDNLKGPQQELNKRRSQFLHHLNQSASSGWIAARNSLNAAERRHWEENSAASGFFGTYDGEVGPPIAIRPAAVPQGHMLAAEMAPRDIDRISGVNEELKGYTQSGGKNAQSGKALELRRDQGLMIGEPVFDNFNYSQNLFYEQLFDIICYKSPEGDCVYSDQEVAWIVQEHNLQADMDQVRDWRTGRYRTKTVASGQHPTVRMANFYLLLDAIKQVGLPIPPEMLIEMSDIPQKEKIVAAIRQQQQQPPAAAMGVA